ncbi:PQQ-binding-like beta-propeller repeat protein [Haladaptatus halobius]|uniref:PQQ-binding-like beta-propeller repeat protein n=1 Tax=Haladaptatus halobius TaxID=2884875 RepID=UPI001D0B7C0A|nr:PQQ-binding-like beta-propeller repeat protein [Haladaptatus halobius]
MDANTGKEQWEYEPPESGNVWATPTVRNGNIYAVGPDDSVLELAAKTRTERRRFRTKGQSHVAS